MTFENVYEFNVMNLFSESDAAHQSPVALLKWSSYGKRLITADRTGSVIGWRVDPQKQLSVIFHHELKDELRGLVFCSNPDDQLNDDSGYEGLGRKDSADVDISGLAKAAVAGDESALDMFTNMNYNSGSRRGSKLEASMPENFNCYAGSASGIIYFLNENGSCMEVLQADGAVKYLLHYSLNDLIIVITESMVIGQFQMDPDGSLTEVSKIKISTRSKENHAVWVGSGLLAIASGEASIRVWDLRTDDNYVLPDPPGSSGTSSEIISSLSYCPRKNTLAAGTNAGYILMWKYGPGRPIEDDWRALPKVHIGPAIRTLNWGGLNKYLAINCVRQVFILTEQELAADYCSAVSVIQTSPLNILVTFYGNRKEDTLEINAQAQVAALKLSQSHLFLYGNGGKIMTYELQKDINHSLAGGEFSLDTIDLVTSDDSNIYTVEGDRINVRSFQGTIKHTMSLNDESGAFKVQAQGQYLMVCTKSGIIRIWDVSKRDMRSHCHPINIREKITDFHSLEDVQMNCNGTFVSVTLRPVNKPDSIDPKLYIYEIEKNILRYFNFASGNNDADDISVPPNSAQSNLRSNDFLSGTGTSTKSVNGKYVVNHSWDHGESNFLACYTQCVNAEMDYNSTPPHQFGPQQKPSLVSLFVHEDHGVVVHDSQNTSDKLIKLIAVEIPFLVTLVTALEDKGPGAKVERNVMSDFVGLEDSDKATKDAVIRFSFYLSIGKCMHI